MSDPVIQLALNGYTVIPIIPDMNPLFSSPGAHPLYQMVKDSTSTFNPEYLEKVLHGSFQAPLVGGSFAALAHAESFHHPAIRRLRLLVDGHAVDLLRNLPPYVQLGERPLVYDVDEEKLLPPQVTQLFDRVLIRPIGAKPTAEFWHRDTTPLCGKNERVFGGWLNLNHKHVQHASLAPGTAMSQELVAARGFHRIPPDQKNYYKSNRILVDIPPGHLFIFDETTVHEVVSKKQVEEPLLRLFFAFLRSTSHVQKNYHPLIKRNLEAIKSQGVPLLKSDQAPSYYPKLYNVNHQSKRDYLLAQLTQYASPASTKFPCVLPPLQHPFPRYTNQDIDIMCFH